MRALGWIILVIVLGGLLAGVIAYRRAKAAEAAAIAKGAPLQAAINALALDPSEAIGRSGV